MPEREGSVWAGRSPEREGSVRAARRSPLPVDRHRSRGGSCAIDPSPRAGRPYPCVMDELAAYEGRLRRAGLPLLIEDYSAYEDIFTRAVPLLALVFGVQLVGAANLDWPVWANALSLAGGLAVLLGSLAVVNRRRGRRAMSVPDRVGPAELAGFVFIPALLPLISGGQVVSAIVTAGGNALLLALIYAVVGIGLLSILGWAGRRVVAQLSASLVLLTRAVPVLLIFMIVLFINTEMWQVFS